MAAAPSRTSWADVADVEPAPPPHAAPWAAAAPASNGLARLDWSSYVPPHLRNRSGVASAAPPPSSSSMPPPRAAPDLLGGHLWGRVGRDSEAGDGDPEVADLQEEAVTVGGGMSYKNQQHQFSAGNGSAINNGNKQ
uniref:Uncharacterized protein n=1 Tax=Leersia perrieri TaxID=77586 RepID=A0A0D9XYN6_9ORYZ